MTENQEQPDRQGGSPDPARVGTDDGGSAADEGSGAGYGNNADQTATPSGPDGGAQGDGGRETGG